MLKVLIQKQLPLVLTLKETRLARLAILHMLKDSLQLLRTVMSMLKAYTMPLIKALMILASLATQLTPLALVLAMMLARMRLRSCRMATHTFLE